MNDETIKLLCRDDAFKELKKHPSFTARIAEGEHAGYCEECGCNTGHLLAVVLSESPNQDGKENN